MSDAPGGRLNVDIANIAPKVGDVNIYLTDHTPYETLADRTLICIKDALDNCYEKEDVRLPPHSVAGARTQFIPSLMLTTPTLATKCVLTSVS
jgi:hypothetical protein